MARRASRKTMNEILLLDEKYPKNLRRIYDPPEILYVKGEILAEDDIAIALVGSRRASIYGIQTCERLRGNQKESVLSRSIRQ